MDAELLTGLRRVDRQELVRHYRSAWIATMHAQTNTTDLNRWPDAAMQLCQFLSFVQKEDNLWVGLNDAVEIIPEYRADLDATWERLHDFTDAEFELLLRAGLDADTAGRIVFNLREGLRSQELPTADDLAEIRETIGQLQDYICAGDFAVFGQPERTARNIQNSNAILGGGGCLVGAVSDAVAMAVPIFVTGSIVGAIVGAKVAFRAFTRRRG